MVTTEKTDFRLYLITDRKLFTDRVSMLCAIEDALKGGVKAVQLREKDLSVSELIYLAYGMKGLTVKYDAKLFVNDRLDIAMSVDADGIHLGQSSMPVHAARRVVGDKMLIGVSTHNLDEARTAQEEGADFITFGPIYPTPSKMKFGEPVGLEALRKVRSKILIPILGIGGIRRDNIVKVLDSGADGIALISGILGAKDVRRAAEEYVEMLPG
jgi:thiamine-phosphate pyrophosphorylase